MDKPEIECILFWQAEYSMGTFNPQPSVDLVARIRTSKTIFEEIWPLTPESYSMFYQNFVNRIRGLDTFAKKVAERYPDSIPAPQNYSTVEAKERLIPVLDRDLDIFRKSLEMYSIRNIGDD